MMDGLWPRAILEILKNKRLKLPLGNTFFNANNTHSFYSCNKNDDSIRKLTKTTQLIDFVTDVTFPIVVGLKIYLNDMLCFANDPLENYFMTKNCRSNFGEKAGACPKNFPTCRRLFL